MARCKYGKLKCPRGGRVCKKRRSFGGSKKRRSRNSCKYGKLKNPRGRRRCKKK